MSKPDRRTAARRRLSGLFQKPAEMEGCDEIDALDKNLYAAAGRIRRALNDPVVPKGEAAIISVTFHRREMSALGMLLDLIDVPDSPPQEYLPSILPLQN